MNEAQQLWWGAWLALEHEAVWLYPVIGARHEPLRDLAEDALAEHRERRDRLMQVFSDAELEPPAPQLSYDVGELDGIDDARAAARSLESRVCAALARLVGHVEGEQRTAVIRALRESAIDILAWGGSPEPFPGLD